MPSFTVNPRWYETFWYSERTHDKRGAFSRWLAHFRAVLASSDVVPNCFHG